MRKPVAVEAEPFSQEHKIGVIPVYGHAWAMELLRRQMAQGKVAHAYLFTGPAQIGRSTLARWLAQALLCEGELPPCGRCPACRRVATGIHPDLHRLYLDQEGNRRTLGIEAVREMRQGIAERPFYGRRKVYLIEDAECMTVEAGNALLKTLEEPPPFVVLLLVALSDHLLLPTIVSRCQVLPLRPLPRREVRQALVEHWGASEEQAEMLSFLCQGRLGWAVQALSDPQVLERRRENLATLGRLLSAGLLERFAFAEVQERLWKHGKAVGVLETLQCWQGWWRDLFLLTQGCADLVVNRDQLEVLQNAGRQIAPQAALAFLQALRVTQERLQDQVNPRLALEELLLQLPVVVG